MEISTMKPKSQNLVDGKYSFSDLVNIDQLKDMFELFSKATGFTTGLVAYPSQKLLIGTGWRDICCKFHRACAESELNCKRSNLELTSKLEKNKSFNINYCGNGLVDGASPIFIKDKHVANLFTGQVLFEEPDIDFFRKQAKKYGYDIDKYLKSLSKVPILKKEDFVDALKFLSEMAVILAEQGLNHLTHIESAEAFAESENRFRSITENAADCIFIKDIDRRYIFVNQAMKKLLDLPEEKILGKNPKEVFGSEQEKVIQEVDDRTFSGETVHVTKDLEIDGRKFYFDSMQTPLTRKDGKVTSIMGIVRDVTEQKKAADELQTIQKLKSVGILAGGIAHDFNNILMGIFGNIALAKDMIFKDHPAFDCLNDAQKSMNRATSLTKQLLTFAKGGVPVREDVSLCELIEEVVNFDLSGSNIKPVFKQDENLWIANVDKGQIHQVFSNLTINALQSMPDGGHLTITMENSELKYNSIPGLNPGKYIKVTVRDAGSGIDRKDLAHIFDPYFSTKKAGNGLGLATVYSIINRHEGHISVDSVIGEGTVFTLYLPASNQKYFHAKITKDEIKVPGKTLKILVMDDEEMIRMVVTDMLKKQGFSIETANDGEQAIKLYRQSFESGQPFEVVIMDLTIPGGMGGKEAVTEILKIDPEAKVIVSSGYSENPVMANHKKYGFKGITVKPYTIEQLLNEIILVLES